MARRDYERFERLGCQLLVRPISEPVKVSLDDLPQWSWQRAQESVHVGRGVTQTHALRHGQGLRVPKGQLAEVLLRYEFRHLTEASASEGRPPRQRLRRDCIEGLGLDLEHRGTDLRRAVGHG